MIPCVTVANMRESDAYTIANFIPGLELMYRAALGIFKAVIWKEPVAIVTGSGNNGGDGFALACILNEQGIDCTVFKVSSHLSGDSAFYAAEARRKNVTCRAFSEDCLNGYGTVVDCLLGTGFQGELRSEYRRVIESINRSGAYVVSADINSGLNGDSGIADIAVHSDLTVTIGFVKKGLIVPEAGKYMKKLVCTDIGIILKRDEFWISDCVSYEDATTLCCPAWLDMNVQKAY